MNPQVKKKRGVGKTTKHGKNGTTGGVVYGSVTKHGEDPGRGGNNTGPGALPGDRKERTIKRQKNKKRAKNSAARGGGGGHLSEFTLLSFTAVE